MSCFRISDGYSFAVEFEANTESRFNIELKKAAMEFFAKKGKWATGQLHVQTETGTWLSANYYQGMNCGPIVQFGKPIAASFETVTKAIANGNHFERSIAGLCKFVSDAVRDDLRKDAKRPELKLVR